MISERKEANALSGRTARACDGCSRRRARWFCVADDAFLCQSCDDSVHSANQLASRHQRVRLESASFKTTDSSSSPTWHQGFTKKARTPRHNKYNHQFIKDEEKKEAMNNNPLPLVPEIGNDESNGDEDEDDLIYRVPVFDPFAAEMCTNHMLTHEIEARKEKGSSIVFNCYGEQENGDYLDSLDGFLSSDVDLAEFATDVENLLGKGMDEDYMKDFKLLECKEEDDKDDDEKFVMELDKIRKVKYEQEKEEEIIGCQLDQVFGIERESVLDWNFNCESSILTRELDEGQEVKKAVPVIDDDEAVVKNGEKKEIKKKASLLRLNYEAIINAWESHGSPWTTGTRPPLNPYDWEPQSMDGGEYPYGGGRRESNGAREARVLRYKEKRRSRLFSKKIRYEVRKLNAEKRPRMKGRFVKRTNFVPPTAFPSYINK